MRGRVNVMVLVFAVVSCGDDSTPQNDASTSGSPTSGSEATGGSAATATGSSQGGETSDASDGEATSTTGDDGDEEVRCFGDASGGFEAASCWLRSGDIWLMALPECAVDHLLQNEDYVDAETWITPCAKGQPLPAGVRCVLGFGACFSFNADAGVWHPAVPTCNLDETLPNAVGAMEVSEWDMPSCAQGEPKPANTRCFDSGWGCYVEMGGVWAPVIPPCHIDTLAQSAPSVVEYETWPFTCAADEPI